MLTNPKFTCRQNSFLYANNPGDGVGGGRVNYPTLSNNITLNDLRGLNLTAVGSDGGPCDPLDYCINNVQKHFSVYFDGRFGQRDESDKDSDNEEDSFSSDEDKENVKENRD